MKVVDYFECIIYAHKEMKHVMRVKIASESFASSEKCNNV